MSSKKNPSDAEKAGRLAADLQDRREREQGYRAKALKILPWICARCEREFSARNLRQLTVHHKDHDHHHNPADSSNWELLCIYCHENEHSRQEVADAYGEASRRREEKRREPDSTHRPFEALGALLKSGKT